MAYRIVPLIAVLAVMGCERRAGQPSVATVLSEDAPDQETWSAHLVLSTEGRPRLELTAAYMASYERADSSYVVLSALDDSTAARVVTVVFDENGETTAVVRSDRVIWFEEDGRLEARGNVIADAASGRRIETEQLEWRDEDRMLTAPGFARVTRGYDVFSGYGLEADEALDSVSVSNLIGQVRVRNE